LKKGLLFIEEAFFRLSISFFLQSCFGWMNKE